MREKNNYHDRLIINTLIFTIGNLGTKILQFFIVPLYSFYLSTTELGEYDMTMTLINLLIPIITIQISDALYRWLIDGSGNELTSYYVAGKILIICLLIFIVIIIGILYIFKIRVNGIICIICIEQAVFMFLMEGIRGLRLNKAYAIFGNLYSLLLLINVIVFVVGLHYSLRGIYLSILLSYFTMDITISFFTYKKLISKNKLVKNIGFSYYINMIKYSVPYIPNTLCWWIVNVSDRWMIKYYLGLSENGIYLVATRLPTIIITFMSFFQLSWQEVAITEYKNKENEDSFDNIFKHMYQFLFTISMLLISCAKYIIFILFGKSYYSAWRYIPILFIGTIYSAMSSFFGVGYQKSKKSKDAMTTTILAAIINVLINLIFLKKFGLYVACISTMVAYIFLFFLRLFSMKDYFRINIDYKDFFSFNFIIIVEVVLILLNIDILNFLIIIFNTFIFIKINKYLIKRLIKKEKL